MATTTEDPTTEQAPAPYPEGVTPWVNEVPPDGCNGLHVEVAAGHGIVHRDGDPPCPLHAAERAQVAAAQKAEDNHAALERAVADLPEVPGRDEFLTMCQLARVYAASGVVPKALREKPADVLVVLMTGRDLGIPLTAALRKVYVIDGQPSIAPQLKLSLIRKRGLGRVVPHPHNERLTDRQGAIPLGPGGWVEHDAETDEVIVHGGLGDTYWYTWDDAIRAGLVRAGCTPDAHTPECDASKRNKNVYQTNDIGMANFCKDNWRKNPRRLLWQRSSGFCADDYFSEATLGLYDPDELGAILDDDGKLIDVAHVEVPDGFGRGSGASGGGTDDDEPVNPEDSWLVQLRVFSLPEDAQEEFKDRWKKGKLRGMLTGFPANKLNLVNSMLKGIEHDWKAQGKYDPAAGPAAFVENVLAPHLLRLLPLPLGWAPPVAPVPPEGSDAADTAPAPENAADGQPGTGEPEPVALPLDAPTADPTDALLAIPEGVRAASDDDKVEWTVAWVKALSLGQVDELLRRRYEMDTKGTPVDRRARLTMLILHQELGVEQASQP